MVRRGPLHYKIMLVSSFAMRTDRVAKSETKSADTNALSSTAPVTESASNKPSQQHEGSNNLDALPAANAPGAELHHSRRQGQMRMHEAMLEETTEVSAYCFVGLTRVYTFIRRHRRG